MVRGRDPTDGPFVPPTARLGERLVPVVYAEPQQTLNGKLAGWGGTHAKAGMLQTQGAHRCDPALLRLGEPHVVWHLQQTFRPFLGRNLAAHAFSDSDYYSEWHASAAAGQKNKAVDIQRSR